MYRFLLLYICHDDHRRFFAEGLIHIDNTVYVRGFSPPEDEIYGLHGNLHALKCYLRDNENIRNWHIQMIDEIPAKVNGI